MLKRPFFRMVSKMIAVRAGQVAGANGKAIAV